MFAAIVGYNTFVNHDSSNPPDVAVTMHMDSGGVRCSNEATDAARQCTNSMLAALHQTTLPSPSSRCNSVNLIENQG